MGAPLQSEGTERGRERGGRQGSSGDGGALTDRRSREHYTPQSEGRERREAGAPSDDGEGLSLTGDVWEHHRRVRGGGGDGALQVMEGALTDRGVWELQSEEPAGNVSAPRLGGVLLGKESIGVLVNIEF